MQSHRVPPPLRQPSPTCSSTPAHLVIPHSHPTGKEHSASPCFPSSLVLSIFHSARSLVCVLPSSEPLSLLHPAHPCPHPSFCLGKKSLRYQKQGFMSRFFSATLPHLSPLHVHSLDEGYQPQNCTTSAPFDRKERRKAGKSPGFYFKPFHKFFFVCLFCFLKSTATQNQLNKLKKVTLLPSGVVIACA